MKSTKKCPSCGGRKVKVIRSRQGEDGRRRLHECALCKSRWTTVEHVEEDWNESERVARKALEDLVVALQTAIREVNALRERRG